MDPLKQPETKGGGDSDLPKLRTFKEDIAEAVKKDNVSVVKMAIAESKKRERASEYEDIVSPHSPTNMRYIIMSIALLVIVLGIVSYFIFFYRPTPPANNPNIIHSDIVSSEEQTTVNIGGETSTAIFNSISNERREQLPLGTIEKVTFTLPEGTSTVPATTAQFITSLQTSIPPDLLRSFDPTFFFGFHSYSDNEPLLILTTNDYGSTYSGMLQWESTMADDISGLFGTPVVISGSTASQTATSTWTFQDKIIDNKDTRALIGPSGNIVFFYSFVDSNTLVFATNATTFQEILTRLSNSKLIH